MCRMLGVVTTRRIPVDVLREFGQLADRGKVPADFGCATRGPEKRGHPDGWGVACLSATEEVYRRSPGSAAQDPKFGEAIQEVARLVDPPFMLIAHVRRATAVRSVEERFSHPFRRGLDGRAVFFAHSGGIEGFGVRDDRTDSLYLFERLQETLGPASRPLADIKEAAAATKGLIDDEFPRKVSSYTFLLSDGPRLIAHRDARDCVPYYALHETRAPGTHLVCSEVLAAIPGRWRLLRNGEFLELAADAAAA